MNHRLRRAVAFVAAELVTGGRSGRAFDHGESMIFKCFGKVEPWHCDVRDHEGRCRLLGMLPMLFDEVSHQDVILEVRGAEFSGFECDTQHHFRGRVDDDTVTVFDGHRQRTYYYSFEPERGTSRSAASAPRHELR